MAKDTSLYTLTEWSTPTPNSVENGSHTLVVTNEFGCKDTAVITVVNYPQPVASFTMDTSRNCLSANQFTFTNTSAISSGSLTYQWNFGDGTFSTEPNPAKSYGAAGTFQVKLVTTSNNGCLDSLTKTITVHPQPAAAFSINTDAQCLRGNQFAFTNSSAISSGSLTSHWTFGDGNSSSVMNPTKSFAAAGTYKVSLVTTSNFG